MSPIPADRTWRRADLGDPAEVARILVVQRAAYAIEAELIGYPDLPPLHEAAEQLAACGEDVWLYLQAGEIVGAVGLANDGDVVVIARLFVAPRAFRQGIGTALVRRAIAHAGGRPMRVGTGARNAPALALYRREGFDFGGGKLSGYVLGERGGGASAAS